MRVFKWFFLAVLFCIGSSSFGQLRKVMIENYYISDVQDSQDTFGGSLPVGSTTYRLFFELEPNSRVKRIFGDVRHPFQVSSTQNFFNNISQGKSFGKDFTKASLSENTVALDSYLTIGQVAKQGAKIYFAVPKNLDTDGSFVGGVNNDGGSVGGVGLLSAENPSAGIPLTVADGNDTLALGTITWSTAGVQDIITGTDTTIFGANDKNEFLSSDFYFESSQSIGGVDLDSNLVLFAQLTTLGELSFDINVEIETWSNGQWISTTYVSADTLLENGEVYSPFLSYPYSCGCMNPDYLEYSPAYVCELEGSCQNLIVYGCMDSMACNYNPLVNVGVEELCCYPGSCNNRDITEVCPSLMGSDAFTLSLFPNPVSDEININVLNAQVEDLEISIYNSNGALMFNSKYAQAPYNWNIHTDVSGFEVGVYQVVVKTPGNVTSKMFFKI